MEENKTVVQESPAMEATEIQPVIPECEIPANNTKKSKNKKIRNIILIAVAVVVLAAAAITFAVTRPTYIAKKYAENFVLEDYKAMDKYLPYYYENYIISYVDYSDEDTMLEHLSDYYDEDLESWDDVCQRVKEDRKYDFEDDYGDFKISSDVKKERDLSVKKAMDQIDDDRLKALKHAGFDWDSVDKVKSVTVHVKIMGDYDNNTADVTVYLMPYSITWNVITSVYE